MEIEARLSDADRQDIAQRVAAILLPLLQSTRAEPSENLISEQRAAAELGVGPHVLRDARKRKEIDYHRVGRFVRYSREQLAAFKAHAANGRARP